MSRHRKELRRHLRNPDLRSWIQKNEAWFSSNPTALHSLLNNPEMLTAVQSQIEAKKSKVNRRVSKTSQRAVTLHQSRGGEMPAPRRRNPLFRLPKLSLSNLNMDTATERLSRAAEVMDTIRNLTGLFGNK